MKNQVYEDKIADLESQLRDRTVPLEPVGPATLYPGELTHKDQVMIDTAMRYVELSNATLDGTFLNAEGDWHVNRRELRPTEEATMDAALDMFERLFNHAFRPPMVIVDDAVP